MRRCTEDRRRHFGTKYVQCNKVGIEAELLIIRSRWDIEYIGDFKVYES